LFLLTLLYLGRPTNHNNKTFQSKLWTQNVTQKKPITLSKSCQILKFENETSWKQNKK
jgi:hypothetical protein